MLTLVHVIGGGGEVYLPILNTDIDPILKGYVSVIWHAVIANLLICSAILTIASRNERLLRPISFLVIAQYSAYSGLFIYYGLSHFASVLVMPPWIGFLGITAVILVGIWRASSPTPLGQPA